jgi:putative glutamine amidotransferase
MRPRIAIPLPTSTNPEYNARAWPQYAAAVARFGGEPIEVSWMLPSAEIARLVGTCQGILLPGSPADVNPHKYGAEPEPETAAADPARENVDELLLQDAHNLHRPLLCICYGMQSLNVWRTGTLVQDVLPVPVNHKAPRGVAVAHSVAVAPESMLAAMLESASDVEHTADTLRLPVNSSHHQAVGIAGDGLRVVARCPQDGVVEAVEGEQAGGEQAGGEQPGHFILGLQWHPERTLEESAASRAIFAHFLQVARAWQPRAIRESLG